MRIKTVQRLIDKLRNKKNPPPLENMPFKQHPRRASDGNSMKFYADWVLKYTTLKPKNIFEIGANYAQDAEGLRYYFSLKEEDVWVFEAHPEICREISNLYNFHVFNNAVFNEEKNIEFNAVDISAESNTGISSLYNRVDNAKVLFKKVNIAAIRMDNFMSQNNITSVDFLKLDVEGCNWEVLDGFGSRLKDVGAIHIEAEHKEVWDKEKLFLDIRTKLEESGFEMADFKRYGTQSDSLWVQKKYLY